MIKYLIDSDADVCFGFTHQSPLIYKADLFGRTSLMYAIRAKLELVAL